MRYIYLTCTDGIEDDILTAIAMWLWHSFGFEVRRLQPAGDPQYAFELKRQQYNASLILTEMLQQCRQTTQKLLVVTDKDLFIPMLSFVYGLAQLGGKVALVSLARLSQTFYGFPENRPLMMARAVKECLHEVGHTFGLVHCSDRTCPMALSTNIGQLDSKGDTLCSDCMITLKEMLDLANVERLGESQI